jgi:hypothetical protein
MTSQELKQQTERIEKYDKLATRLREIENALLVLHTPFGFHKCSAFTGNTRESRRVLSMRIQFSHTSGREEPVDLNLTGLNLQACVLGNHIEKALDEQRKAIVEEMEKL